MSRGRTDMRKIRDIVRLHFDCGMSTNKIAQSLGVARSVVQECLRRIKAHGLSWPLPSELDDGQLEKLLYGAPKAPLPQTLPDLEHIHQELRKAGVTRELLWIEYKDKTAAQGGHAYSYQQYCRLYKNWCKKLNVVMRQEHRAGEKMFVDYAGKTIAVVDQETGEVREAQLFVAVLGASNYTYVEAGWGQDLDAWIGAHVRAFDFFGGVPELVIPDNLKSAVTRAHRHEPELNQRYHQMARHYRTSILPARPRKPRDKAKVEKGVQFVETWIHAVLRNHTFFSLTELNITVRGLLEKLNEKPFKRLEGSRRSWFEAIDKPALKPLPDTQFEDARWLKARVGNDYHINVDGHYYSVPYTMVGEEVEARWTTTVVEILFRGNRITSHRKSRQKGKNTTKKEHRPDSHRFVEDWTPERITAWASKVGPATTHLVHTILINSSHPQIGLRACLGLLNLHGEFGADRLESACQRAATSHGWTVSNIRSLLKNGLDQQVVQLSLLQLNIPCHENVRGAEYFRSTEEERSC